MLSLSEKESLIESWNRECPNYPLFKALYEHACETSPYIYERASHALRKKGELIGCIVAKLDKKDPYKATKGQIAFMYVFPKHRKKGYGKTLLDHALNAFRDLGITRIDIGTDMHPLFPGVPEGMDQGYFERRGFINTGKAFNLITKKPLGRQSVEPYRFHLPSKNELPALYAFIRRHFSPRWARECQELIESDHKGKNYLTLMDGKDIIAFTRINIEGDPLMHNINYQTRYETIGGIGPLGTAPAYRHRGLARALIKEGVAILFERGASDVLVDWTGLTRFYEKIGFTVCHTFTTLHMET